MSDSSESNQIEAAQSDNSETIQSDTSESLQSNSSDSESMTNDGSTEIIETSDPNVQFDAQELIDFRVNVKKHIDNMNKLKQLNDGQKSIQAQKKAILDENKRLQSALVSFAEDYGINKMTMKNGYVLTFTTIERPKPINEEILRTGIAEQLKHYRKNDTIGTIGIDKFINELIGSIDTKRKEGVQAIKSVKITKPKGGQKRTIKKRTRTSKKKNN